MNLVAYDKVKDIDFKKPFINTITKRLYMFLPKKYVYYGILKRFDNYTKRYAYYLFVSYNINSIHESKKIKFIDSGRAAMDLKTIWDEIHIDTPEFVNIKVDIVEEQEDGIVFELDI